MIEDAALDDLVGDLARGPVSDGAPRLAGGFAGHRDDGTDLLGRNPRSLAGARRVAEALFQARLG
jgi:hypothetical protein